MATLVVCTPVAAAGSPPYGIKPKPKPKPNQYNVVTQVAIADSAQWVRRSPALNSRGFKRLWFYTPDHEALQTFRIIATKREVGHVTYRWVKRTKRRKRHRVRVVHWVLWDHIAVPGRPNGQSGWVESSWLGAPKTSHTLIVVSREHYWMHVYRSGKLIFTAPVGVGNTTGEYGSTPTGTPGGHFWIAEAFPSSDPFYGPWAFGTTDYAKDTDFPDGSIVGIHGTNEPAIIPGDVSHGCVRLKDPDILKLKRLVGIGTPVWIE